MSERHIVIFDGVCNFCNGAVNFIIRRDPEALFSFTPMQSESGQRLIEEHGATMVGIDTFLLIKNGQCYERTDAAFEIASNLTGLWSMLGVLKILPKSFRDYFYKLFARNRYKLFGRRGECIIPSQDVRDRFIE
jgi:predicted DCC family thiol-disulfide oxidoreductase YuxK